MFNPNMMNGDVNRSRATGTSLPCYFCDENYSSPQSLQHHVKQCGSVLDKCPKGCGSWMERKHMVSHQRQCSQNIATLKKNNATMPTRSSLYNILEDKSRDTKLFVVNENVEIMKKDMEVLKLHLNEEAIQREYLKNEIEKMKRQYVLFEDRNQILVTTVTTLRKLNEDNLTELRNEVNNVHLQYQKFNDFIDQVELRIDSLQKLVEYERNERSHLELIVNNQDGKLRNVNKIEADLESIKYDKNYTSLTSNDHVLTLEHELKEIKRLISQENTLTKQQMEDYKKFQSEIEKKVQDSHNVASKLEKIDYEMKTLKIAVEEDSSTLGMIDKNMNTLSKRMGALQSSGPASVEILQDLANSQPKIADTSGHLLWRIDYYHQKLKDAVENGTVLKSQIFLSSKYGYTLQAELNLNGIGKWRGRHLIATVQIIPGEFDPILEWPASLDGDIIIKDQTPKKKQAIDITKPISVKTKDVLMSSKINEDTGKKTDKRKKSTENLSSSENDMYTMDANGKRQYIFIPHTSLDKLDYIKNNVMFLEIIIQNQ